MYMDSKIRMEGKVERETPMQKKTFRKRLKKKTTTQNQINYII